MAITWVAVANRTSAAVYENRGPGKGLTLAHELSHESARLQDKDLVADKQGRTFERTGSGRHVKGREMSAHDREARKLATELAQLLERARTEHTFDRLVLVAEPRFLGMLRDALDEETREHVTGTVHKDLAGLKPRELEKHVGEVMAV